MNPDTIGCVWTGEFDLNTLRVDGEIFESRKKKLWIQKYPDTCGRGLKRMGISVWRVILVHVWLYLYFCLLACMVNDLEKTNVLTSHNWVTR